MQRLAPRTSNPYPYPYQKTKVLTYALGLLVIFKHKYAAVCLSLKHKKDMMF